MTGRPPQTLEQIVNRLNDLAFELKTAGRADDATAVLAGSLSINFDIHRSKPNCQLPDTPPTDSITRLTARQIREGNQTVS